MAEVSRLFYLLSKLNADTVLKIAKGLPGLHERKPKALLIKKVSVIGPEYRQQTCQRPKRPLSLRLS